MGKKILIVGGVAGGASAAAKLRRNGEDDTIIMFEKGPHVSFSNCSLPYHLSGMIEDADSLVLMNPEIFWKQYRIDARVNQEVTEINRNEKFVIIKNLVSGEEYRESYDKLILSPGAFPIVPKIPGIENVSVFTIRNVVDIDRLNQYIIKEEKKEIVVIGGGFIGVEAAENLGKAGYQVTLVEGTEQILRPYDYDMVQIFHKELMDKGIQLIVEDTVVRFEPDMVVLSSGRQITADAVVMAIGVLPEVKLAREAGLEIGETGAILTDGNYRTSDPDIYAVGDAIEVYNSYREKDETFPGGTSPERGKERCRAYPWKGNRCIRISGFFGNPCL